METLMTTAKIAITAEEKKLVRICAAERGVSPPHIIGEAIRQYLQRNDGKGAANGNGKRGHNKSKGD